MVTGSGLISLLITLVVVGLIFWVIWWGISAIGIPEPFGKVIRVVVILVAVIFLISILLRLLGHPLVL